MELILSFDALVRDILEPSLFTVFRRKSNFFHENIIFFNIKPTRMPIKFIYISFNCDEFISIEFMQLFIKFIKHLVRASKNGRHIQRHKGIGKPWLSYRRYSWRNIKERLNYRRLVWGSSFIPLGGLRNLILGT